MTQSAVHLTVGKWGSLLCELGVITHKLSFSDSCLGGKKSPESLGEKIIAFWANSFFENIQNWSDLWLLCMHEQRCRQLRPLSPHWWWTLTKQGWESEMQLWHKGTIQCRAPSAAPKDPNNQPLNNSPDLSGHRATPPLILPNKTPTFWLTF